MSAPDLSVGPVSVVIPALNEEQTVQWVVQAARGVSAVRRVIVVDNMSTDDTARKAREAGAQVVSCSEIGKGQAIQRGLDEVRTLDEIDGLSPTSGIVFLDADLRGLTREHVESLIHPLSRDVDMVCGHICNTKIRRYFPPLPLTGQRSIATRALERVKWERCRGYSVEVWLSFAVPSNRTERIVLDHVQHTRREAKVRRDWTKSSRIPKPIVGLWTRLGVAATYVSLMTRLALAKSGRGTSHLAATITRRVPIHAMSFVFALTALVALSTNASPDIAQVMSGIAAALLAINVWINYRLGNSRNGDRAARWFRELH